MDDGGSRKVRTKIARSRSLQKASLYSKARILLALIAYSIFYGAFIVNLIDLNLPVERWYHIFLIMVYFSPSILILIIFGWRSWKMALALGLLISLMNDLLYGPVGNALAVSNYDLGRWYAYQLGLYGLEPSWTFRGGLLFFRVTSILMGVSIYVRLAAACILLIEWWKE